MKQDLDPETVAVIKWIRRMASKYGGIVYGKDGKTYDWGQALMRECYGPDWCYLNLDKPTLQDVSRALAWENGEWPEWAKKCD
ncbi:MAG: hypothetical protein QW835_00640 [Candidatus Hadarchaeum sp.]